MPPRRSHHAASLLFACALLVRALVAAPSVRITPPAAGQASPSAPFGLAAAVASSSPDMLSLRWSCAQLSALASLAGASARTPNLVLPAGALPAGAALVFELAAADASGNASASVFVQVAVPPAGGTLTVTPAIGFGLAQSFNLSAPGWSGDSALTYTFYATPPGSDYTAGRQLVVLTPALPVPFASVLLPAAKSLSEPLQLLVIVRNAYGATATASTTAVVTWPTFTSSAQQLYISQTFRQQTDALIASNDTAAALQLLGVLGTMLNAKAVALDGSSIDLAGRTQLRGALLDRVAAAANATLATDCEFSAAAVSLLVAEAGAVSRAASDTALGVLDGVAAAGAAVSLDAAAHTGDALSSLVDASEAAVNASDADAAVLVRVLGVLESLSASFAAQQLVPGLPPLELRSSRIALATGLDTPAQAAARAFTAPGTNATFDPLPPDALSEPAASLFLALDFDPWAPGSGGRVARLAFTAPGGGAQLLVSRLRVPITFSLDAPPGLAADQQARCRFWDAVAGAYSSVGCTAMPNPAPPGDALTLSWDRSVTVSTEADLAMTWQTTGPLAAGCASSVVDCGGAGSSAVFWEGGGAASAPLVTCAAGASGLRVFSGTACALTSANNSARCGWDVATQGFVGAGCVAASSTRCACTHLTDFKAEPAPIIRIASLSQLAALQPDALVTQLKLLLAVILALFVLAHAGAALGLRQERAGRIALLARLRAPELGFIEGAAAWTWALEVTPATEEVGPLRGSAVLLAAAIGVPFARLRCAIPEELLAGAPAQLTGRRRGLSVAALRENAALAVARARSRADAAEAQQATKEAQEAAALMAAAAPPPSALLMSAVSKRHAAVLSEAAEPEAAPDAAAEADGAADVDAGAPPLQAMSPDAHASASDVAALKTAASAPPPDAVVCTALVFAFMASRRLLPRRELAARQLEASRAFAASGRNADGRFERLNGLFRVLLGANNMRAGSWLPKARLWRAVLLSSERGDEACWEASDSLAFTLQASAMRPSAAAHTPSLLARCGASRCARACLAPLLALAKCCCCGAPLCALQASDATDATSSARAHDAQSGIEFREDDADKAAAARAAARPSEGDPSELRDCPLTFSGAAIRRSMPPVLRAAVGASALNHDAAMRVWATALTVGALRTLPYSWAACDAQTLPDRGASWLAAQPLPAGCLAAVLAAAEAQLADWRLVQKQRISAMREAQVANPAHASLLCQRAWGAVVRVAVTQHETLSPFLASQSTRITRAQRFLLLCSCVVAILTAEIWLYYSRSLSCCLSTRALLGCSAAYGEPCRGFGGSCSALASAFRGVAAGVPTDWECTAFPAPHSLRDRFLAALIGVACSLPVKLVLEAAFEAAHEAVAPEHRWMRWPAAWQILWKRQRWAWARAPPGCLERAVARAGQGPLDLPLELAAELASCCACAPPPADAPPHDAEAAKGVDAAQEVHDADVAGAARGAAIHAASLFVLYSCWAVFAWLVFVYGSSMYELSDESTELGFARSWAVGLGLDQAYQWRHVAKQACLAVASLLLLEQFVLGSNDDWFESHVEWASVHAVLLSTGSASFWHRTATHLKYFASIDERQQ